MLEGSEAIGLDVYVVALSALDVNLAAALCLVALDEAGTPNDAPRTKLTGGDLEQKF